MFVFWSFVAEDKIPARDNIAKEDFAAHVNTNHADGDMIFSQEFDVSSIPASHRNAFKSTDSLTFSDVRARTSTSCLGLISP